MDEKSSEKLEGLGHSFEEPYFYTGGLTMELLEKIAKEISENKKEREFVIYPWDNLEWDLIIPDPTIEDLEKYKNIEDRNYTITTEEWTKDRAKNWIRDTSK